MKLTSHSGLGTTGLLGVVVCAGVIWGQLDGWWLVAGIALCLAGIGNESPKGKT
jgi:hypothetical protein